MLFVYRILINIIFFLSPIIIIYRILNKKESLKRFKEKFCFFSNLKKKGNLVWFHGASVGELQSIVPILEKLEKPWCDLPKQWYYIGIFPNAVFGFYPDSVIFYQEVPVKCNETLIRSAVYKRPKESRHLKILRYLSGRIDNSAVEEDNQLSEWLNEAPKSSGYEGSFLSDLEKGVRDYHDALREMLPVIDLDEPPISGKMSQVNAKLLAREN